jgi:hypothetical protein
LSKTIKEGPTSIPNLFLEEKKQFQEDYESNEDQYIQLYKPTDKESISDLSELAGYVLQVLREPI